MTQDEEFEFRHRLEQEQAGKPAAQSGFSPMKMVENIPASGAEYVGNIVSAIRHPIDTAGNLLDVAAGGLQKIMPESVVQALDSPNAQRAREKAGAVGEFYKERYGTGQGALTSLQNDPVGVLGDFSTLLTGGGGAVARIPGLAKAGGAVSNAGSAVEPLVAALRGTSAATSKVAPKVGGLLASVVGGLGTHTGGAPIREAASSGMEGGARGEAFIENLRGNVPATDVVNEAKMALDQIRQNRGEQYRAGMSGVSKDPTILDMQPIADAYTKQASVGSFKGEAIKPSTVSVQKELKDTINNWAGLDPVKFHTPEGLDALKQKIGDIRDSTEVGSPSRKVADNTYHAVKEQIVKQAPEYGKIMKDYEQASDLLRQIESSLSLNNRASADTALRKLQSLTRNNVNTNYGERMRLGEALQKQGGADNLMASLAGQSLNQIAPRGLGNLQAGATAAGGLLAQNPAVIPILLGQSPRLVGESAYYTGKLADALRKSKKAVDTKISPANQAALINALRQSGQLNQEVGP